MSLGGMSLPGTTLPLLSGTSLLPGGGVSLSLPMNLNLPTSGAFSLTLPGMPSTVGIMSSSAPMVSTPGPSGKGGDAAAAAAAAAMPGGGDSPATVPPGGKLPSPLRLGNSAVWQCAMCDKRFTKRSNAKRHLETVHDRSRFWRCKLCRSTFTQRGSLTRHLQRAHAMTRGSKGLTSYVDPPSGMSLEGEAENDEKAPARRPAAQRKRAPSAPRPGAGRGRGAKGKSPGSGGMAGSVAGSNLGLSGNFTVPMPTINFAGGAGATLPIVQGPGGLQLSGGSGVDMQQLNALLTSSGLAGAASASGNAASLASITNSLLPNFPSFAGTSSSGPISASTASAWASSLAGLGSFPMSSSLAMSIPVSLSSSILSSLPTSLPLHPGALNLPGFPVSLPLNLAGMPSVPSFSSAGLTFPGSVASTITTAVPATPAAVSSVSAAMPSLSAMDPAAMAKAAVAAVPVSDSTGASAAE